MSWSVRSSERKAAYADHALRVATADHVELLISDIGLPDGSGLDLMRQISPRSSIGAIALSGFGMDDDMTRSLKAGFARHVTNSATVRAAFL